MRYEVRTLSGKVVSRHATLEEAAAARNGEIFLVIVDTDSEVEP